MKLKIVQICVLVLFAQTNVFAGGGNQSGESSVQTSKLLEFSMQGLKDGTGQTAKNEILLTVNREDRKSVEVYSNLVNGRADQDPSGALKVIYESPFSDVLESRHYSKFKSLDGANRASIVIPLFGFTSSGIPSSVSTIFATIYSSVLQNANSGIIELRIPESIMAANSTNQSHALLRLNYLMDADGNTKVLYQGKSVQSIELLMLNQTGNSSIHSLVLMGSDGKQNIQVSTLPK